MQAATDGTQRFTPALPISEAAPSTALSSGTLMPRDRRRALALTAPFPSFAHPRRPGYPRDARSHPTNGHQASQHPHGPRTGLHPFIPLGHHSTAGMWAHAVHHGTRNAAPGPAHLGLRQHPRRVAEDAVHDRAFVTTPGASTCPAPATRGTPPLDGPHPKAQDAARPSLASSFASSSTATDTPSDATMARRWLAPLAAPVACS